jgi:hypothetical protein
MRDGQSAPVTHLRRCRGESVARHRVPQPLGRAATPVTGGAGTASALLPALSSSVSCCVSASAELEEAAGDGDVPHP